MKRFLAAILSLVLAFGTLPFALADTLGDVDGDGSATSADAAAILRHIVGLSSLSEDALLSADINGDGSLTASDAAALLRLIVGMSETTAKPTDEPTAKPTEQPTDEPTAKPTEQPTDEPTEQPTDEPTPEPTPQGKPLDACITALGEIEAHELRIRTAPDATAAEVGLLYRGDKVNLYHLSGTWYYVYVTESKDANMVGKQGYMSLGDPADPYIELLNTRIAAWGMTSHTVDVYKAAGATNAILTSVSANQAIGILATSGNWYRVRLLGTDTEGYVLKDFIGVCAAVDAVNFIAGGTLTAPKPIEYSAMKPQEGTIPTLSDGLTALGTIDAEELYLRKTADANGEIITLLTEGMACYVYEKAGDWYHIQVPGLGEGFAFAKYIKLTTARVTAFGTVLPRGAFLRETASDTAKPYTVLPLGTKLGILAKSGNYYKVRIDGYTTEGYVLKELVTLTGGADDPKPSPTPTPTPTPNPDEPTPEPTPQGKPLDACITALGEIEAHELRIRTAPDATAAEVGLLYRGDKVNLYHLSGTWYYVYVTESKDANMVGKQGYMSLGDPADPYIELLNTRIAAWGMTSHTVDVYKAAGATNAILTSVSANQAIGILATSGNWYRVRLLGTDTEGYVLKDFIGVCAAVDAVNFIAGGTLTAPKPIEYSAMKPQEGTIPTLSDGLTALGTIDAEELYLRKTADANGEIITLLTEGMACYVYEKAGDWYHIQVPGLGEGFAFAKYIKLTTARVTAFGTVLPRGAFLRETASDTAKPYTVLPLGTKLGILAKSGNYYKVRIDGYTTEGYILKELVTLTGSADPS